MKPKLIKPYNTFLLLLLLPLGMLAQSVVQAGYEIAIIDTFYSEALSEEREIYIYVPTGFWGLDEEAQNCPVTIVLDGESQFLHTASAIDFLSAAPMGNDYMPRSIVVGIPNTNRLRDYTPFKGSMGNREEVEEGTGGGQNFLAFLTTELIPYIDSNYSTIPNRTIIGHSLGGLIVMEALLKQRDYFDHYLAIDPAMDFDNGTYLDIVLDSLEKLDLQEEKLFVSRANTVPPILAGKDISQDNSNIVSMSLTNLKFLNESKLRKWNISCSFIDYPEENHFSIPYKSTIDGLKYFYSYYPFPEIINYYHPSVTDSNLVDKLKAHFKSISEVLQHEAVPMESYLNSWAFGIAQFDRSDLTIDLLDYSIALRPEKPSTYNTKAEFMTSINQTEEAIHLYEQSLSIMLDENIKRALEGLRSRK